MELDTIVALATPAGYGGIGIIRVSGLLAIKVARIILKKLPKPRQAEYSIFYGENNSIIDKGMAIFFPKPNSFTGEDILELQGHGSPVTLDLLLKYITTIPNLRIALPGEFSKRAFLNNKIDLTQAEAISDLINASSVQAAKLAINSLQGTFSNYIYELVKNLINLRTYVEAAIDFSNEELDLLSKNEIKKKLNDIFIKINKIKNEAQQGFIMREGAKIVIIGKPNAGKSTLLNSLARREIAIVTANAGTTRDLLHAHINLDGIPLHIIDTAGLHDDSNDEAEQIGIKLAWREIDLADQLLLIVDGFVISSDNSDILWPSLIKRLPPNIPITIIRNKADLTDEIPNKIKTSRGYTVITLSAKNEMGLELLLAHLKQSIGFTRSSNTEGLFLARRRHLLAIESAINYLEKCKEQLLNNYTEDILAENLRLAQQALYEITGEFRSNDLLNKIFSTFCIGK